MSAVNKLYYGFSCIICKIVHSCMFCFQTALGAMDLRTLHGIAFSDRELLLDTTLLKSIKGQWKKIVISFERKFEMKCFIHCHEHRMWLPSHPSEGANDISVRQLWFHINAAPFYLETMLFICIYNNRHMYIYNDNFTMYYIFFKLHQ